MKKVKILLSLISLFITTSLNALGTEGLILHQEHHFQDHKRPHLSEQQAFHPVKKPEHHNLDHVPKITSPSNKPAKDPLLALTEKYQSDGLSLFEALAKAKQEMRPKQTSLEKELQSLGCVQWSDVKEISPNVLEVVKAMRDPNKGAFILKPGLTIVYLNDRL